MRYIITFVFALLATLSILANQDVTTFLGIPVDGPKSEMVRKLKAKGFKQSPEISEALEGEFNGAKVRAYILTNGNKVSRIMLCDAVYLTENLIRTRFNNLCEQFKNNPKYITLEDYSIPENEKIMYEMSVNNKEYAAFFFQKPSVLEDPSRIQNEILPIALEKLGYNQEDLINYSEAELDSIQNNIKDDLLTECLQYSLSKAEKQKVWFIIGQYYNEFFIVMYYDNIYNQANGEDL
ncbi:MAG: hypothetical protein K2H05_04255 [Duncaniella sp.]|nr:hypothetical protein [Duncaniella sp.]